MINLNIAESIGILEPKVGENPTLYAERLGEKYSSCVNEYYKKSRGQFFTPLLVAKFMADFSKINKKNIKILDPGCGVGILSITVLESIAERNLNIQTIELVAFETDVNLLPLAETAFTYLANWLKEKKIELTFFLCKNDFILHNSKVLNNQESIIESYDLIISNPPYFKLPKEDERAIAAKSVIYGQTNIYTIFLLIATKLLNSNGQLIFIIPRSFCSGNYFRQFREIFFNSVKIEVIHLFNSRTSAFKRDSVLQENLVIVARKNKMTQGNQLQLPFNWRTEDKLIISTSFGLDDLNFRRVKEYYTKNLLNINSFQKILHLPTTDVEERAIGIFKNWKGSLNSYGLEISTGPVVDFRSKDMICQKKTPNTVPLFWLHNIEPMKIIWPRKNGFKGKSKGQYIINKEISKSRLIQNKNYVLLRRFSSKDDNKRLIAAPYFSTSLEKFKMIGVENHLNYIYRKDSELNEDEIIGLSAILNCSLFDLYFRTFNGNINVSATEIRGIPLPDFNLIKLLGTTLRKKQAYTNIKQIDLLVSEIFNVSVDL